ncbi:sulfatase-like hydrolase/transferase [Roseateles terrae]|uniref:Heptose-I-phosphate ethanolaminephosphotransferase n=1 Tax=Roseateles terrae TaxID=431060 RepID=A0ABR6GXY6_9BURK|nr:phosphoethanolamine transferase [Roseateles terrae]MBB3196971.1 heptose-I-phosphate ethanolaminephosphotransferase [Roseateles terrae]OWQ84495.1 hypothetical protein CDN98_18430 [Roseateles terrae]
MLNRLPLALRLRSRPRITPLVAAALLCLTLAGILILTYESHRVAQVFVLALAPLLWLRWPLTSARLAALRFLVTTALVAVFLLDAAARLYLQQAYQAAPDSALVIAAVANTTPQEAREYLTANGRAMLPLAGVFLIAAVALTTLVWRSGTHRSALPRWQRRVLGLLALLCLAALLIKPWRRHHPLIFWPQWAQSVADLQRSWSDQRQDREQLLANARAQSPVLSVEGPSTVVLVLTDSVNRDNMSLYGYTRPTTPQLESLQREEQGRMLTIRHAWSAESGTVASLSGLFSFGDRAVGEPAGSSQHLLALARAAGYRVWWMSNHDDLAIEQQHARLADEMEMINRAPGRSTVSLDGELLDCLEEALVDPAPRKLIVVHLLGAHPHYALRAPAAFKPFADGDDSVEQGLQRAGQPLWIRSARRAYDTAIAYHDTVVAQSLRLTRQHTPRDGHAAWMFLSDHGQEVGHEVARAGHSPGTPAGYRVPAVVWRSQSPFDPARSDARFRVDWAAWTLASLMHLRWREQRPERDVLDPAYVWQPPLLQVRVARYDR